MKNNLPSELPELIRVHYVSPVSANELSLRLDEETEVKEYVREAVLQGNFTQIYNCPGKLASRWGREYDLEALQERWQGRKGSVEEMACDVEAHKL